MFEYKKQPIVLFLFLYCFVTVFIPIAHAQDEAADEKIMTRYKQMLERKPKEGSTFDRLYQLRDKLMRFGSRTFPGQKPRFVRV